MHRAGLQADLRGFDFQPHPFAGFGQRAHRQRPGVSGRAEGNQVLAPVGPMLPRAVVELQHDLLGRIRRIEIDVGEQLVALADLASAGLASGEEVLAQARRPCGATTCSPLIDRVIGLRRRIASRRVAARLRAGGQSVVDPHVFLRLVAGAAAAAPAARRTRPSPARRRSAAATSAICRSSVFQLRRLLRRRHLHDRRRQRATLPSIAASVDAVEEGEELIELLLRDRIELVVVADRAAERQAQPHGRRRLDAIDGVAHAALRRRSSPLRWSSRCSD